MNHDEIVSFLWSVSVLRRLDCVLAPTKERVLQTALISAAVTGQIDVRDEVA